MILTAAEQDALGIGASREDDAPVLVVAAVHEAGHAVARMLTGIDGADLHIRPDGRGRSDAATSSFVDSRDLAVVTMAGPVAEAEFQVRYHDEGLIRFTAYTFGGADGDLATLRSAPAWAVDPRGEALALAIIRVNWSSVIRVAAAVLKAPSLRITWAQQLAAAGALTDPDDTTFQAACDDLESGDVDSLLGQLTA